MIIRRRHTANFTTIGNALFDDERLAADEVGILAYLLSRPHDWEVRRPALMRRWDIGPVSLKRIINNWMLTGWARSEKVRLANGTFDIVYEIRDEPGPTLTEDDVLKALSLVSSEAETDEIGANSASDSPSGTDSPPPCQPGVAQPPLADPYVANREILNTDSPRTESNQIERGQPVGYDRKAAFLAAFESRWPTSATDDRAKTAKAARDLPAGEENAALSGIGTFLEKLKRDGRKHVPAGWKYLEQKPWTLLGADKSAEVKPRALILGAASAEAAAVIALYAIAHVTPYRMQSGDVTFVGDLAPQLLALSSAAPRAQWQFIEDRNNIGAWREFVATYVKRAIPTFLEEHDGKTGIFAPWPWPPKKDGTLCTGPPDEAAA